MTKAVEQQHKLFTDRFISQIANYLSDKVDQDLFIRDNLAQASSTKRDGSLVGRACLQVGHDHYCHDYHDYHDDHYDHIEMMMMMIMIILKDKNDTTPLRQGVEGARVLRSVMTDTPW